MPTPYRYAQYKRAKREALAGSLLGSDRHAEQAHAELRAQEWADSLGHPDPVNGGGWGYRESYKPQPLPYGWSWTLSVEYNGDAYDPGDPLTYPEAYQTLHRLGRAERHTVATDVVRYWAERVDEWTERGALGLCVTIHAPDGRELGQAACYGYEDDGRGIALLRWAVLDVLGEALYEARERDREDTREHYESLATYAATA